MKITKQEMAKKLAAHLSTKVIAGILYDKVPRAELERLMLSYGFSLTTDLCEGCGHIVKSWYDHAEDCRLK